MTNRKLLRQIGDDLEIAPRFARQFFLRASRRLLKAMSDEENSSLFAYGIDCHRELLRAPGVVDFVEFLLTGNESAHLEFLNSLWFFGRKGETLSPDQYARFRIGLTFLIDALGSLFDGTLGRLERPFAEAYQPIISLLFERRLNADSYLELARTSFQVYRAYMDSELAAEQFDDWTCDVLASLSRVAESLNRPAPKRG